MITILFFFISLVSTVSPIQAETIAVPLQQELETQGVQLDLGAIVSSFINLAIILAVIALFFYFILGGYKWLTSNGDKTKVEEARSTITNGLIGLAIMASIYAIMSVVTAFFGIDIGLSSESSEVSTPDGYVDIDCSVGGCNCGSTSSRGCVSTCRFPSGQNPSTGSCL